MRCSYEAKLAAEQETGLRLRGELGILKKKAGTWQAQMEEVQGQLAHARGLEASLHQVPAHAKSAALLHCICML